MLLNLTEKKHKKTEDFASVVFELKCKINKLYHNNHTPDNS